MVQDNRPRAKSGQTVTVACKLPHGLALRLYDMVETNQPVMGGGMKVVKQAQQLPGEFMINGNAHAQNAGPACQITGGYALTPGVPKDFWDRWLEANKGSDMVRNNLIFAHEQTSSADGEAREKEKVRSGLERLDPNNLPRGLRTADAMSKETKDRLAAA